MENVLPILDSERNGSGRAASGCKREDSRASWGNTLLCWRFILGWEALRNDDVTGCENPIRLTGSWNAEIGHTIQRQKTDLNVMLTRMAEIVDTALLTRGCGEENGWSRWGLATAEQRMKPHKSTGRLGRIRLSTKQQTNSAGLPHSWGSFCRCVFHPVLYRLPSPIKYVQIFDKCFCCQLGHL